VTRREQLERLRSPAFRAVVKRIAKRVGGAQVLEFHANNLGTQGFIAFQLTLKKPAQNLDVKALADEFAAESALVVASRVAYRTTKSGKRADTYPELIVLCAATIIDAVTLYYGDQLRTRLELLDRECGIAELFKMERLALVLNLARTPKRPAPLIRALIADVGPGEGATSATDWKQQLAFKRAVVWWEPR